MKGMGLQTNPPGLGFSEIPDGVLNVPRLSAGDVQLWAIGLNPGRTYINRLGQMLSASELERAGRFLFARDRRRYIVRHGFLRWLLGQHLFSAPEDIRFAAGPSGKPCLAGYPGLHFNLSHSGEMALIGLSPDNELGVDIESTKPLEDADAIVHRMFTITEASAYFRVQVSQRTAVFFNCWTRKEAFVKARGQGLSLSPNRFEVSVLPGETARLIAVDGDREHARDWTLLHLEPAPGFIAALAIQQVSPTVKALRVDLDRTALPARAPESIV